MDKRKRYVLVGTLMVFAGTALSVYFDGENPMDSKWEKVGYIVFFAGIFIASLGTNSSKKRCAPNRIDE